MSEINSGALVRLAMWAKNMTLIKDGRMEWPGFSYSDDEWQRMYALSAPVTNFAYQKYIWINAVVFIVIAAIGIAAIFLPLATVLFPVPAETSALKFSLLLASCAFLIIGGGLPISLRIAAWMSADSGDASAIGSRAGRRSIGVENILADQPHHPHHVRRAGAGHVGLDRLRHRRRTNHHCDQMAWRSR